jgi:hypothetical protein
VLSATTGEETELRARGRHDPCVVPRAVPMVESMVAMVLADQLLQVGSDTWVVVVQYAFAHRCCMMAGGVRHAMAMAVHQQPALPGWFLTPWTALLTVSDVTCACNGSSMTSAIGGPV